MPEPERRSWWATRASWARVMPVVIAGWWLLYSFAVPVGERRSLHWLAVAGLVAAASSGLASGRLDGVGRLQLGAAGLAFAVSGGFIVFAAGAPERDHWWIQVIGVVLLETGTLWSVAACRPSLLAHRRLRTLVGNPFKQAWEAADYERTHPGPALRVLAEERTGSAGPADRR